MLWLCSADALEKNQQLEFERNKERFAFLKVSTGALSFSSRMLEKKRTRVLGRKNWEEGICVCLVVVH